MISTVFPLKHLKTLAILPRNLLAIFQVFSAVFPLFSTVSSIFSQKLCPIFIECSRIWLILRVICFAFNYPCYEKKIHLLSQFYCSCIPYVIPFAIVCNARISVIAHAQIKSDCMLQMSGCIATE